MIRVQAQPEYSGFHKRIRMKGQQFLSSCPRPTSKQFRKPQYWRDALEELRAAYNRLCAYTTRELVDTASVDHFKPKSKYPLLAYEWDNFRLARQKINSRKGESEDVLDPFEVQEGWFNLDLPSCLIKPGEHMGRNIENAVKTTIKVLGLNSDDRLVEERHRLLMSLADRQITLEYLDGHYPFLSAEIRRQHAYDSLQHIFSRTQL